MLMNFSNILKILPGILKAGEVTAIAANDGYQSQTSKVLGGLSQATNLVNSVVPGSGTAPTDAATPSPKPVAPPKTTPGPTVPKSTIQAQKAAGRITNVPKPQAELLKVKSNIPKASNPNDQANITKGYLKGLEQSGAKLDNKGQIVKQSGKAFKTKGWDRKAQLMGGRRTPDRLQKLRMLAIDKAANAEGIKAATGMDSNKAQTKDEAKIKWSLDGKSEEELKEVVNRLGLSDYRL
jgi:hypothetical protein